MGRGGAGYGAGGYGAGQGGTGGGTGRGGGVQRAVITENPISTVFPE